MNYAREKGVRTVLFSLLGTVLSLKCPPNAVAKVALGQISAWLQNKALGSLEKIILCAHGPVNQKAVKAAIEEWVEKDLNPPGKPGHRSWLGGGGGQDPHRSRPNHHG